VAFVVVHADGRVEADPALAVVEAVFGAVEARVAVRHERGWRLTAHPDGVVELDCDTDARVPVRHAPAIPPGALPELAVAIAVGSFYEVLEHEWLEGPRGS
jgi:hypothetical protein